MNTRRKDSHKKKFINLDKTPTIVKASNKDKIFWTIIILIGTIFILLPCFNTNIWFDETYSIELSKRSISDIILIGSHDVHPVGYYLMLHFVLRIFNNSVIAARIFSIIPIIILGILGYTHIRKDFGTKVGKYFTFFSFFTPTVFTFGTEIRMYTWAILFVTLTFIYSYRILKHESITKNWILLTIFSICSCYTHYYGLFAAVIMNASMLVYFIVKSVNTKKNPDLELHEKDVSNTRKSFISCLIDAICYIPWVIVAITQAKRISDGNFWIGFQPVYDFITFQITGFSNELSKKSNSYSIGLEIISLIYSAAVLVYLAIKIIKNKHNKEYREIWPSLYVYFGTIIMAIIGTIAIWQSIIYQRYFVVITSLYILFLSFILADEKRKYIGRIICTMTIIFALIFNISAIMSNYSRDNNAPFEFVKDRFEGDDTIIVTQNGNGFAFFTHLGGNHLFWNNDYWSVEDAYKAYGDCFNTLDDIKDLKGRVWLITGDDTKYFDEFQNYFSNSEVIEKQYFHTTYRNFDYNILLVEIN